MTTCELLNGPFRRSDAAHARVTSRQLDELVISGAVVQVLRGVYLPTALLQDVAARAAAVSLVLPLGAAICRRTAAWLHGIDARKPGTHRDLPPLECLVPRRTTPVRRPGLVSFASTLPPEDISTIEGIPTTTPLRTALDLARWAPRYLGLSALDAYAHAGLVDPQGLDRMLDRIPGQRYVAQARELVRLCEPRTESHGESWMRLRLVDAGLPRPTVQISLRDATGAEVFRLDSGFEEYKIAAEYDGEEFHLRTAEQQEADLRRREAIHRLFGWTAFGFTTTNVLAARPPVEQVVGEAIGWTQALRRRAW